MKVKAHTTPARRKRAYEKSSASKMGEKRARQSIMIEPKTIEFYRTYIHKVCMGGR